MDFLEYNDLMGEFQIRYIVPHVRRYALASNTHLVFLINYNYVHMKSLAILANMHYNSLDKINGYEKCGEYIFSFDGQG